MEIEAGEFVGVNMGLEEGKVVHNAQYNILDTESIHIQSKSELRQLGLFAT